MVVGTVLDAAARRVRLSLDPKIRMLVFTYCSTILFYPIRKERQPERGREKLPDEEFPTTFVAITSLTIPSLYSLHLIWLLKLGCPSNYTKLGRFRFVTKRERERGRAVKRRQSA